MNIRTIICGVLVASAAISASVNKKSVDSIISENVEALTKVHIVGDRYDENPIIVEDNRYTYPGYVDYDWNNANWNSQWAGGVPLAPVCKGEEKTGRPNSSYCATKLEHFDYWE